MNPRCQPSELRIPNDPAFATAAAKYVVEVARAMGFTERDLRSLDQGVWKAVTALMEYSFEPGEKAVLVLSCEYGPEGLKLTIMDKGLPFGAAEAPPGRRVCSVENASELCSLIFALKADFDEIRLEGLGQQGKQTILIKRPEEGPSLDYHDSCESEPEKPSHANTLPEVVKWTVRQVMPSEAPEVSKLLYQAYGYTYSLSYVYRPEEIISLNERGEIHSAVALTGGEIAGHCAFQLPEDSSRIAELAQAVVKPEYRSRGCLKALTEYFIRLGREKGLHGLFTQSVTEHVFSQKTAHRFAFRDCALSLGIIPKGTLFKGIGTLAHRGSLLAQFRYLQETSGRPCFAPSHHREMIARIYENLGPAPEIQTPPSIAEETALRSNLNVHVKSALQFARIVIEQAGSDILDQVKIQLKELCRQGFEIIHIHLNLGEPRTARLTEDLEGLGFFFCGLLPCAFAGGDALILQFLNGVRMEYDAIRLESETALEMLAYIKAHDPN